MALAVHPEAPVHDAFTSLEGSVPFDVGDGSRNRWIGGEIFWRRGFKNQAASKPDQIAGDTADGEKVFRLPLQPVPRNRCRPMPLVTLDHRDHDLVIACVRGLRVGGAETAPFVVWPYARVVTLDVEHIEPYTLPVEPHRMLEPLVQIPEDALGHA